MPDVRVDRVELRLPAAGREEGRRTGRLVADAVARALADVRAAPAWKDLTLRVRVETGAGPARVADAVRRAVAESLR